MDLIHNDDPTAEEANVVILKIMTVNQDLTLMRIVKPLEQGHAGTFATSCGTNESDLLAWFNSE